VAVIAKDQALALVRAMRGESKMCCECTYHRVACKLQYQSFDINSRLILWPRRSFSYTTSNILVAEKRGIKTKTYLRSHCVVGTAVKNVYVICMHNQLFNHTRKSYPEMHEGIIRFLEIAPNATVQGLPYTVNGNFFLGFFDQNGITQRSCALLKHNSKLLKSNSPGRKHGDSQERWCRGCQTTYQRSSAKSRAELFPQPNLQLFPRQRQIAILKHVCRKP
jgi:hypothetical protein